MAFHPVFIVGSPRSGTSILISALLRAGYNGFYEGNFLPLARIIERDVDRHFSTFYTPDPKVLISKIDSNELKQRLARVVVDAALAHQPASPWVDKTGNPEMIEAIPMLRRMFPDARFIFAKRRAIENVVSRLVKFPGLTFDYHCADWARTMAVWRKLRDTHPGNDLIEVDQRLISLKPQDVAGRLGSFLQLDPSSVQSLVTAFTSLRPQQTASGTADRVLSLAETKWTTEQLAVFQKLCGAELQREGYSTDERYWSKAPALAMS